MLGFAVCWKSVLKKDCFASREIQRIETAAILDMAW